MILEYLKKLSWLILAPVVWFAARLWLAKEKKASQARQRKEIKAEKKAKLDAIEAKYKENLERIKRWEGR